MKRGYWKLQINAVDEGFDSDADEVLEQIQDWISKGCTEGECFDHSDEREEV